MKTAKKGNAEELLGACDVVPFIGVLKLNYLYVKRMFRSVKMKPETEMTSLTLTKTIMKMMVRTSKPATAAALSLEETVVDSSLPIKIS